MGFPIILVKLARDLKHDRLAPQKVANRKGNGTPASSGKSRLVKFYHLARLITPLIPSLPKSSSHTL